MSGMQTYTGKRFYPLDPRIEDIDILDIAQGLSQECRYGSQCNQHYSVAQHSYLVSKLVSPKNALQGLMHDAAEGYIKDLPRDLKKALPGYKKIEDRLLKVIFERFNIRFPICKEVHYWDTAILLAEKKVLFNEYLPWSIEATHEAPDIEIDPWPAKTAKAAFLIRFRHLMWEQRDSCRIK